MKTLALKNMQKEEYRVANIVEKIKQIRQAVYGKDVRESIASGMEAMNQDNEAAILIASNAVEEANEAITLANTAVSNANTAAQSANIATENAETAAQNANDIASEVERKLNAGEFVGEKGDTGESGITTPINSMYTLSVDADGGLYVNYNDSDTPPSFVYDSESGNLYYEI